MSRLNSDVHPLLTTHLLDILQKNHIYSSLQFIRKKPLFLSNITGLQYVQVLKIRDQILAKYSSSLKRGDKYYKDLINHCAIISSGIDKLDGLLNGGFITG